MFFIRTLLAFFTSMIGMILALPILVVGLPFLAVAFLTRKLSRLLKPQVLSWEKLIEYYPTIGWKTKANLDTYALGQDNEIYHFTTDSNGWRCKRSIEESKIVVFGDSFAFGFAADDNKFFTELNHDLRIKAIGAIGYNMVQSLLWMERLSSQIKGKLVIWFIYYGNDLYENLQPNFGNYRMPFVRKPNSSEKWEIVTSHVSPEKWLYTTERKYYDRLAEICCPSFLAQRVFSSCEFLIEKGRNTCNEAGAQLIIMTVPETTQLSQKGLERLISLSPKPESFDPDLPDKRIREICSKFNVPFIPLKKHLKKSDYKVHDCHWNEKGHQYVANLLYELYHNYSFEEKGLNRS